MNKLFAATLASIALASIVFVPAAHAHTTTNALFVCEGELVKNAGGYEIIQRGVKEDDYPMDCYIDPGKTLRQILAVCHVGDICIVSAKGESGNGNRHLIQKVSEVQRSRQSADHCAGILHKDQNGIRFGGGRGEDEGICVIDKSEEKKVLAVCSIEHYCKVKGQVDDCKDSGECSEITNISSVSRKK